MDIDDPIRGSKDPDGLVAKNEEGADGFFPIGEHGFWHGGVHLQTRKPIVAVLDGTLVAWRIDEKPKSVELEDKKSFDFSTGFALIRHETATPLGQKIEFWSLYMHLLHYDAYVEHPELEPPVYLNAKRPEKVKTDADGHGLRLAGPTAASSVGVVPRDAKIVLTGEKAPEGHWAKGARGVAKVRWGTLEGWLKIDDRTSVTEPGCKRLFALETIQVLSMADPGTPAGEIPAQSFFDLGTGRPAGEAWRRHPRYTKVVPVVSGTVSGFAVVENVALPAERRVTAVADDPGADKRGLAVRAAANAAAPVIAILPKGSLCHWKAPEEVRFSATTTYHEIREGGFVPVNKSTLEEELAVGDPRGFKVFLPVTSLEKKISRGDILGWAGIGARETAAAAGAPVVGGDNLIHFEIFSTSDELLANPHNEHWFNETYRLPVGATLKQSKKLPPADNPEIPVDLPAGSQLRIVQRFPTSDNVKAFRHEVIGWRRTRDLGHAHAGGYPLHRAIDVLYRAYPATCWCDEAHLEKATWGADEGDYFLERGAAVEVPETFKRVRYQRPVPAGAKPVDGWAREHELGDYYPEAHQAPRALTLALTEKPADWLAAQGAPADKRLAVAAGTWVRRDSQAPVSQGVRKVKHGTDEGWIPKARLGPADPATKLVKLLAAARLLKSPPAHLDDLDTGISVASLAVGAAVTDLGVDQSVDEPWIKMAFRDEGGTEITGWARASELGPIVPKRYVVLKALPALLEKAPASLAQIDKKDVAKLPASGVPAGAVVEWLDEEHVAKETWRHVALESGEHAADPVWLRAKVLGDAANLVSEHYILAADLDYVLPAAPTQVDFGGATGNVLTVLEEATSDGVTYQHVKLGLKKGWWPKDELGEAHEAERKLTTPLPHILKDKPKDPPDKVHVTAHRGDAVLHQAAVDGAYTKIQVIVTVDSERANGFLRHPDTGSARDFIVPRAHTSVLKYDPDATFVFDEDAGKVPAAVDPVALQHEFTRAPRDELRRDKAGHLWTEVAGQGWVNLNLDVVSRRFDTPGLTGASPYDWLATWSKYSEEASTAAGQEYFSIDGLCDVVRLVDLIDKNPDGTLRPGVPKGVHVITPGEMRGALQVARVQDGLRHAACLHPSEWDPGDAHTWERLHKAPWNMDDATFDGHMTMIRELQFWKEAFPAPPPPPRHPRTPPPPPPPRPSSPTVWHFHPLGFVKQLRGMKGVTVDQLQRILPDGIPAKFERFIPYLNEAMERYEIDTPLRQAHFLAQIGHESGDMNSTVESGAGTGEQYEWRFDLHNVRPGDGERFKGRGLMQLTGRLNYSLYSAYVGIDLTAQPELLGSEVRLTCDVSGWFWRYGSPRDLNDEACDTSDLTATKIGCYINRGHYSRGLEPLHNKARLERFRNALRVLGD